MAIDPTTLRRSEWTLWHTLGLLLALAVLLVVAESQPPVVTFPVMLVLLSMSTILAGHGVVGSWRGLLIDQRNRMSLSRLQMVLWTVVVLSAFITAALWNIRLGEKDPLAVAVPQPLWWLMGISTTSLVGSPLIRSTKTAERLDPALPALAAVKKEEEQLRTFSALQRQGVPPNTISTQGNIVVWQSPECARLADLFQGEEVGNAAVLDLGKLQMFYFTLIVAFSYGAALAHAFAEASRNMSPVSVLPALGQGMVVLLGISHAGYLTNKAVPHSAAP